MTMTKLTRKDQVLSVLRAGGEVRHELQEGRGPHALPRLFDAAGIEVPAWLTAIKAAEREANDAG